MIETKKLEEMNMNISYIMALCADIIKECDDLKREIENELQSR